MTIQPSPSQRDDIEVVIDTPPPADEPERTTGDLVGAVGSDLGELLSMHLDLARLAKLDA